LPPGGCRCNRTTFNDGDSGRDFYGVYATRTGDSGRGALDLYALGLERDTREIRNRFERRRIATPSGARWAAHAACGLDVDVEGGYQFGEVGSGGCGRVVCGQPGGLRPVPDCPLKSRWFVGFDLASGDDDPADGDVGTFNQLFPAGPRLLRRHRHVVGRQNISRLSARAFPCRRWTS
jgi:hypothetical protein